MIYRNYTYLINEVKLSIHGAFILNGDIVAVVREIKDYSNLALKNVINLRNTLIGKYVIYLNGKDGLVVINDPVSSYRTYYDLQSGNLSNTFSDFMIDNHSYDYNQIHLLEKKGYTQGNSTIFKDVKKVMPSAVYYSKSKSQKIFIDSNKKKYDAKRLNNEYITYIKNITSGIDHQKIGVAFSGGLDSLYVVGLLNKIGIKPRLFHLLVVPTDDDGEEDFLKASIIAEKLDVELETIKISREQIIDIKSKPADLYRNDLSFSFVAIKKFLNIIDDNKSIEILFSGQNADSFLNYGVTRRNHPVEAALLYLYKVTFRKFFNSAKLSSLDLLIMKYVYFMRRIPFSFAPKNWTELQDALAFEQHYVPIFLGNRQVDHVEYQSGCDDGYIAEMYINKLQNHIGGNHSWVWTENRSLNLEVFLPFSEEFFHQCGMQEMAKLDNFFEPKQILADALGELDLKYTKLLTYARIQKNYFYKLLVKLFKKCQRLII